MINKEVIIIGAGPAGLMAANIIDKEFILLEKNNEVGKKILISGSGQCNYTNACKIKEFNEKFGNKKRFVQYGFSKFSNEDSINFFRDKNLMSYIREDGKVFPSTLNAEDIINALTKKIKNKIKCDSEVLSVERKEEYYFIKTKNEIYKAKYVIISTGGRTYPKTGSTGDGYKFAKNLGINIVKLKNGLCGLNIYEDLSEFSGISFKNISGEVYRNDRKIIELSGDLLFTHIGLSGPSIINNSRYINEEDIIKINFSGMKKEEFENKFIEKIKKQSKKTVINNIKEFDIPDRIIFKFLEDIELNIISAELNKKNRNLIIKNITEKEFTVKKVGTLHNSMVTVGGIDLKEINKKSMECKNNENLFFIGEVLDVDGDTGGYNIQWAFTSANLASSKINEN